MKYLLVVVLVLLAFSSSGVICNSTNQKKVEPSTSKLDRVSDQVTCSICNFITEETEKYIKSGANDSQIISILDNDCERFGDYESTCEDIVAWYTPTIIYLLEKNQSPQTVCSEIRLC